MEDILIVGLVFRPTECKWAVILAKKFVIFTFFENLFVTL